MLFSLTCKSRKWPESIGLPGGLGGYPLSLKQLVSSSLATDVTVDANILQSEIHVLQADLAVFSPNVVMFIKTELSLKQKSHSKSSWKCNLVLHF